MHQLYIKFYKNALLFFCEVIFLVEKLFTDGKKILKTAHFNKTNIILVTLRIKKIQ